MRMVGVLALLLLLARVSAQNGNGVTTSCTQLTLCGPGCVNTNANGTCYQCGLGWYKSTQGSSQCLPCPATTISPYYISSTIANCWCGKGSMGPSGGPCTACAPGKAKSSDGSSSCYDCPAGMYSDKTGKTTCDSCPIGTYSLSGASVCVQCPPNSTTQVFGTGPEYCECIPGFIGPESQPRVAPCTACPAGTDREYTAAGTCYNCARGKYSPTPGTPICLACPVSKYADAYRMTACIDCTPNSNSPSQSTSSEACTCNAGYYGNDYFGCVPCGHGQYQDQINMMTCISCPAGTYSTTTAATACLACPNNTNSPIRSSSSVSCICNAGYTGPNGGVCSPCNAGTYKSNTGSGACIACTPNSISPSHSTSSGACKCNAGYYGNQVYTCQACPVGTYRDPINDMACLQCPTGKYTNTSGSALCTDCPVGTFTIFTEGMTSVTTCLACLPNSGSTCNGCFHQNSCKCNTGYSGYDGGVCTACESGKYKDITGMSTCVSCPMGKYSHKDGLSECIECPSNSVNFEDGSTSINSCLCNIDYSGPNGGPCSPCPAGTYKNSTGNSSCIIGYVVKMAVSIPLTRQEFNDSEQLKFTHSVARAAGVSSDDVSIDRIVDMNNILPVLRRLLTTGIRVDTSVKAPDETTASAISTSLTTVSLNSELVAVGLPAVAILEAPTFAPAVQVTTPPPPPPPPPTQDNEFWELMSSAVVMDVDCILSLVMLCVCQIIIFS